MLSKIKLIIATVGLITLFSCNSKEKEVSIFKGHGIKCAIPIGWTLKQIDSTNEGGFSILQQETTEIFKPTICFWTDDYSDSLAKSIGVKSIEFMVQMTITSAGDKTKTDNFLKKYETNMGDILNQKQTTTNFFIDFKSTNTDAVVTILAGDNANKPINGFYISAALTPETMKNTKTIADKIATSILKQLNVSSDK